MKIKKIERLSGPEHLGCHINDIWNTVGTYGQIGHNNIPCLIIEQDSESNLIRLCLANDGKNGICLISETCAWKNWQHVKLQKLNDEYEITLQFNLKDKDVK